MNLTSKVPDPEQIVGGRPQTTNTDFATNAADD
jgi:hypothetical protein